MKKTIFLVLIQAILSLACGILSTKMSWIGKVSIQVIHRDYLILKSWWKTALVCFLTQLILLAIFQLCRTFATKNTTRFVALAFLALGLVGLYFTYIDFTETSHRMLKLKFHIAGYLFWASWLFSCLWYILLKYDTKISVSSLDNTPLEHRQDSFN